MIVQLARIGARDGYVNRRGIVFDADTGKFKRKGGADARQPPQMASGLVLRRGGGGVRQQQRHFFRSQQVVYVEKDYEPSVDFTHALDEIGGDVRAAAAECEGQILPRLFC